MGVSKYNLLYSLENKVTICGQQQTSELSKGETIFLSSCRHWVKLVGFLLGVAIWVQLGVRMLGVQVLGTNNVRESEQSVCSGGGGLWTNDTLHLCHPDGEPKPRAFFVPIISRTRKRLQSQGFLDPTTTRSRFSDHEGVVQTRMFALVFQSVCLLGVPSEPSGDV